MLFTPRKYFGFTQGVHQSVMAIITLKIGTLSIFTSYLSSNKLRTRLFVNKYFYIMINKNNNCHEMAQPVERK